MLVLTQAIGLQITQNSRRVHADTAGAQLQMVAARQVAAVYKGSAGAMALMSPGQVTPLSMASEDFDVDGIGDLAIGFGTPQGSGVIAIHRGNLDAYAPQSAETFQAIASGNRPSPYLPDAKLVEIPVRPDFLAGGDVFGHNGHGMVTAARGGNMLYVLASANGKMGVVQSVPAAGTVTALSVHQLQAGKYAQVVVGAHGPNGPELDIYSGSDAGLSQVSSFPLTGDATSFVSGSLDSDNTPDVLVLSGGHISILHGGSQTLEPVNVPYTVSSAVLGRFLFDRGGPSQMGLLASDGSLHILTRDNLDTRPFTQDEALALRRATHQHSSVPVAAPAEVPVSWKEMESYPAVGTVDANGKTPLMMRTRISSNTADDIVLLNAARLSAVVHSDLNPGSGVVIDRGDLGANAAAAVAAHVGFDVRPGLVYVNHGGMAPMVTIASGNTFYPNITTDPTPPALSTVCNNTSNTDMSSTCSLREAVLKANADSVTDTIMLAASTTYTLTITNAGRDYTGYHGALYVNRSMNIMGANEATTIIQAGTSAGGGVDMVMAVNEDINPTTNASASISNLTMQNGTNRGAAEVDGDGGGMEFDTGTSGTATLMMNGVTLTNNQTLQGSGGGIALFNYLNPLTSGAGASTFTNCSITSNSVALTGGGAAGGGIWVSISNNIPAVTTLSGTHVDSNNATGTDGLAGGILFDGPAAGATQSTIHGGSVSSNSAATTGGGIEMSAGITIDQQANINTNTAGANGGGIWMNISPDTATFSNITIAGNKSTSGAGGGIFAGNSGGTLNMTYSRIALNTSSVMGTAALDDQSGGTGAIVTAQDNWWGTDVPGNVISPSTSTCPATAGKVCFDPWIDLTLTANPTPYVKINTTTALTASIAQDNHGTAIATSNLAVLASLPITFGDGGTSSGSVSNQQANLQGNFTATANFNANSTPGTVSLSATVDSGIGSTTVYVVAPPTITKSFNPTTVVPSAKSTITFSLNNPNTTTIDASFADTLPSGMTVNSTPNVSNTCGGTVTATGGSGSITFTNATWAVGACTIKVDVTAPSTDQVATNSVTLDSTDAGNSTAASAMLTVINPPSAVKTFGAGTIGVGGNTTLTIAITNNNTNSAFSGLAFTDTFPSGMVIAATPALSNTCGGTATGNAGASILTLASGTLAAGSSCAVSVSVTASSAGSKTNVVTVSSTNGGTATAASATLIVDAEPTFSKAFGASSIPAGGNTSLTFSITNPNSTSLTGLGFTDTLPSGLTISSAASGNTCGGSITATVSGNSITFSGGTLAGSASCSFAVGVTGTTAGTYNNTTSAITSNEAGTGSTASATLLIEAPPSIAKAFSPTSITAGGTTTLTFTITNPTGNPASLTGVAFTDMLPTGLTVASGSTAACGSGTLTTTAPRTITLSGGTIAMNAQCMIPVMVTGASPGSYTNTTGNVTSTNGGTGNTASAGLTVATAGDLAITKTHSGYFAQGQLGDVFYLNVSNVGSGATDGSMVTVTDTMPAGFTVTGISGGGWTCTTSPLQCTRTDALAGGSSYATITIAVNVNANASTPLTNTATVSGGGDTNPVNNSASDTVAIGQTAQMTLTGLLTGKTGTVGGSRTWTITVTNHDTAAANNTAVSGFTLTQTAGTACTPVIGTLPTIGTIAASGGTGTGTVNIDFTGCASTVRFKAVATFVANGGANGGTMTLLSQGQ